MKPITPEKEAVLAERREKIWVITLNRPERLNAINEDWKVGMKKALGEIESDPEAKVVILKGAGRAFCVGGDLKALQEGERMGRREDLELSHGILQWFVELPQVVISQIHGYAIGAGMSLAMASDLAYASGNAKFSQNFLKMGLIPDWGALYFLPRLTGLRSSKELLFFGEPFGADVALKLGIINGIFPEEKLEEEVNKIASTIAFSNGAMALKETKRILNKSSILSLKGLLEEEALGFFRCQEHPDYTEGLKAFREKRKPNFT
jgi:2-(1,2-epoxy-1,2-dihydrophenyl)acetyl-CoA isomerase